MNSIAMCTYNGEKYIREQLMSIINQSLQPDEIVICDDCSKDHTVDVIRNTLKDWNGKWKLVCNEVNLGYKKNFEKAISLCHGDIIYLSDQDDVWDFRKIEIMDEVFRQHPQAVTIWHDAELVDASLRCLYPSFWQDTLRFNYRKFASGSRSRFFVSNIMQGSACAFRKEVFRQAAPFPVKAIHDEWLLLVSLLVGEVIPLPNILMKYRQADNVFGGLPMSIKERMLFWRDPNRHMQSILKEVERRRDIFNEIVSRNIETSRCNILNQYSSYAAFLTYRLESIKKRNLKLVLHFSDYQRYSNSTWFGFKTMVKDYMCML